MGAKRKIMQKLYCYIDESGQDVGSEFFVVVAVVSNKEQYSLREQIIEIESETRVGKRKWHKVDSEKRKQFLQLVLKKKVGRGEVYFVRYQKPLPYFLPMLEILEKSIRDKAEENYKAIVYIDGIDKKKAFELTNALRLRGIKLEFVRSARDESEPLIRLADRWAGCIRAAFLGKQNEKKIFEEAEEIEYLHRII